MRGAIPGFHFDSKRKTATFEVIVPGTNSRKRIRKTISVDSREDALVEWKRFRESVLAGVRHTPLTLREFVDHYWQKISAGKRRHTVACHRSITDRHILPAFGSLRLDRITAADIKDFTASMKATYSVAFINDCVRVLSILLHQAVERNEIHSYPIRGRVMLPVTSLPKLEMSAAEKSRFLAAFDDEAGFRQIIALDHAKHAMLPDSPAAGFYFQRFQSFRPVFVVALETGLRKSDLLGLNWSSVDWKAGTITVKTGKTGQEIVIPMSRTCRQALEECKARPIAGRNVFVTEDGKPISDMTVRRYFAIAKQIAGITRRLRFHDLRHTFGSTLASAGVPLQIIAKALGHSTVRMSERYARPSLESLKSIQKALDQEETNSFSNSSSNGGKHK